MKWYKPQHLETKIKSKFAILPIRINQEIRWLEWVNIKYCYYQPNRLGYSPNFEGGWVAIEFVEKQKQKPASFYDGKKHEFIRIQTNNEDCVIDYDKERNIYRVSIFEDNHFLDEFWFNGYVKNE